MTEQCRGEVVAEMRTGIRRYVVPMSEDMHDMNRAVGGGAWSARARSTGASVRAVQGTLSRYCRH